MDKINKKLIPKGNKEGNIFPSPHEDSIKIKDTGISDVSESQPIESRLDKKVDILFKSLKSARK